MKISFWIPATVLYVVSIAFSNSVHVGTVLFTEADLLRKCWTENEKSLLKARLIMQDLLPDPNSIDFSNPKAAAVLLDYFLACFEIINKFNRGKVQNLMYISLADALGGYLRGYVLPSVKRAYYAGQLNYKEAKQIFRLQDHIKEYLKTNGEGWVKPQKPSKRNFCVSPLVITGGSYDACNTLRIIVKPCPPGCYDESSDLKVVKPTTTIQPEIRTDNCSETNIQNSEKPKCTCPTSTCSTSTCPTSTSPTSPYLNSTCPVHPNEEKESLGKEELNINTEANSSVRNLVEDPENETEEFTAVFEVTEKKSDRHRRHDSQDPECTKTIIVPLPVLDDSQNPQSIAVPFKNRPLRNLHSASSAFILEYYYTTVIKCLIAAGKKNSDIKNFNEEFHSWLVSQVLPHLNEDHWYAGFGGVLRVLETIKKFGVAPGFTESRFHDKSYLFEKGIEFEIGVDRAGRFQLPNFMEDNTAPNTRRHVITAVLVVSLLWIFLFCACLCFSEAKRGTHIIGTSSNSSKYNDNELQIASHSNSENLPFTGGRTPMCFQFLINLFKNRKPKEKTQCEDQENEVNWNALKLDNKDRLKKYIREDKNRRKTRINTFRKYQALDEIKRNQGQGDFGFFGQKEFSKPILPYWSSQYSLSKNKIKVAPEAPVESNQPQKQPNRVTLLWRKPSVNLTKNDKRRENLNKILKLKHNSTNASCGSSYGVRARDAKKSKIKGSICSCCGERCQQSSASDTNCSSRSKLVFHMKRILTSTTIEYFENVKTKHKPLTKRMLMASTEESECDDEVSSSYEGDY